jgi:hypothetical protein
MVLGETLHVLKVMLVELTLGQHSLRTWIFITEITNEFIPGLDVVCP